MWRTGYGEGSSEQASEPQLHIHGRLPTIASCHVPAGAGLSSLKSSYWFILAHTLLSLPLAIAVGIMEISDSELTCCLTRALFSRMSSDVLELESQS